MKVKLTISYDGTNYCGWQSQPNGNGIPEELEKAIKKLTGEKVSVVGSGRTDAGVHAEGQVASFSIEKATIPAKNYAKALNTVLPVDIRVVKSAKAKEDFCAINSAKKKTYKYTFYKSQIELPLKERYETQLAQKVNVERIKECAKLFVGEHDFKCFCASGSSAKTTVRTIYEIKVKNSKNGLEIFVTGNGFLYKMVRSLVGTLIAYGEEKIGKAEIEEMLKSGKKQKIRTMPAKGLCLISVKY
jgi:tRNA pseudouridine38-40 synthase